MPSTSTASGSRDAPGLLFATVEAERRFAGAIVALVAAVVFLGGSGNVPLRSWREAREGLVVQAELRSGDWVLPRRNGVELPTKPPLFYWLAGAVAVAHGEVDAFAVRLPSALLALTAVMAVFAFAARAWGAGAGLAAALVLATSAEWIRAATSARVDMTQAAALTAVLLALATVLGSAAPAPRALLVLYVSMGLATLAKGPTGILLPSLAAGVYLAIRRDHEAVRRLRPVGGLALAAAIAAPWYVTAAVLGGEAFVRQHLLVENLGRFFAPRAFGVPHVHPVHHYVPAFLAGFLPWSPILLFLAPHLWRERRRLDERGELLPLVWAATIFVFFSLARGKRAVYLLPIYPAAALLAGRRWAEVERGAACSRAARTALAALAGVGVAVAAVAIGAALAPGLAVGSLASVGAASGRSTRAALDLAAGVLGSRPFAVAGWSSAVALAAALLAGAARSGRARRALIALALLTACGWTGAEALLEPAEAARRSHAQLLEDAREIVGAEDQLVFFRTFDHLAAFYAGRDVARVDGDPCSALRPGRQTWALVSSREWARLDARERAELAPVLEGGGSGPRGRDRLVLARVSEAACR